MEDKNKDKSSTPSNRGGLSALLNKKDVVKPIDSDWVRVGIIMHPDDLEFYRNFYWFMLNKAGNVKWGHKEVQHHLMELVKEKYGKIPERSAAERASEQKNMKPKKKN